MTVRTGVRWVIQMWSPSDPHLRPTGKWIDFRTNASEEASFEEFTRLVDKFSKAEFQVVRRETSVTETVVATRRPLTKEEVRDG